MFNKNIKQLENNNFRLSLLRCQGTRDIKEKLNLELEKFSSLFPAPKEAKILLKPNLNSNMNALTGNTTDLRILAAVIEFLKNKGYKNIILGEGTSSGFYREKINIFSRLYIDRLAQFYNVKIADFNYAASEEITFEDGQTAKVAKLCKEADFFINLPKLKTHFEVGLSACLKNMMGALVGVDNKQKTHRSLFKNILNLNKYVKPDLHIVDGLICMEGNGPSSGTPVKKDLILIGTDAYLLDIACARIAGFDYSDIPYLKIAQERGIINKAYIDFVDSAMPKSAFANFKRPKANPLVKFINNPRWQHCFVKLRLSPGIKRIFSLKSAGKLLNATGLRQDVFAKEETTCNKLFVDFKQCNGCKKCLAYCPMELDLPEQLNGKNERCVSCLYCFLVCPRKAVKMEGSLGFLSEQLKRYEKFRDSI